MRERTRIAADVHDSLGHRLSLIALRAGRWNSPRRWSARTGPTRPIYRRSPRTQWGTCGRPSPSCGPARTPPARCRRPNPWTRSCTGRGRPVSRRRSTARASRPSFRP
ncbi:histidine kinase [Streptomyces microflavus]|uniref:histidine kinase n=1 Tax=Streptomyces microflavus TaxID=1919 RepID=UPI0038079949